VTDMAHVGGDCIVQAKALVGGKVRLTVGIIESERTQSSSGAGAIIEMREVSGEA
jgi:carbonic anhydrase/acetyltransferase-like protein (isoleucine patch superfamily)